MTDELAWQSKSRFFYMSENKYPRMFIVHVWNIFSGFFFIKQAEKKKPRMSQDMWIFSIKLIKSVNHHTNPMNILGFFPTPKLGLKALYVRRRIRPLKSKLTWIG